MKLFIEHIKEHANQGELGVPMCLKKGFYLNDKQLR